MNILLYSHSFLPKIGGREIVVYQLARALAKLGHDARVVGPKWSQASKDLHFEVPVHRYPRVVSNLAASGRLKQFIGEMQLLAPLVFDAAVWRCDVVHAHSLYPGGYVARFLKKLFPRTPLILTPHGIDINTVPDLNYGMRLDPRLRQKIDLALANADAVTAISDGVRLSLEGAGVPPEKIVRIDNGIDLKRFEGDSRQQVRSKFNISMNRKLILSVGNYNPLKGHIDILEAMPDILVEEPKACLVIVGAGTEALKPAIEMLGIGDAVVLTGSIPPPRPGESSEGDDTLGELYLESDVYVSASNAEGAEGLSLSILDALAAGLPIVATDVTGSRDVVDDGINGYLVEPSGKDALQEAIVNVLSSDGIKASMAQASKAVANNYGWQEVAQRYVELYQNLGGLSREKTEAGPIH